MNRMVNISRRQLALLLEHEIRHPLPQVVLDPRLVDLNDFAQR